MNHAQKRTVLAVAGIDPSGGAGLLIDCAAIRAVSCHPAGVASVLTNQDGTRFFASETVDVSHLLASVETVLSGMDVGAVKIGALKTAAAVGALAALFSRLGGPPVIVDPVMRSTSGGRLLDEDAVLLMARDLFPCAALVTPNLAEAALLADMAVQEVPEMIVAATRILAFGPGAVLVKGGHLGGGEAIDVYVDAKGVQRVLKTEKKVPYEVRGTGCALSSLIAAWVACGMPMPDAVEKSRAMLGHALRTAVRAGRGPRVLGSFVS